LRVTLKDLGPKTNRWHLFLPLTEHGDPVSPGINSTTTPRGRGQKPALKVNGVVREWGINRTAGRTSGPGSSLTGETGKRPGPTIWCRQPKTERREPGARNLKKNTARRGTVGKRGDIQEDVRRKTVTRSKHCKTGRVVEEPNGRFGKRKRRTWRTEEIKGWSSGSHRCGNKNTEVNA